MSSKIFTAWLSRIDVRMRLNDRKIALAMDHCPAHPSDARLIKIELIPPPNTTSVIQPLDGGIIRCLKAHYRRLLMDKILQRLDAGLEDTAQESSKSISVLDALHLISKAWKRVSRETEQNFFHKYGFAPAGSSDDCAADEVDNLRLDPSFITLDDAVECVEEGEEEAKEDDHDDAADDDAQRNVISRIQPLRHFDELKIFFEENGMSTAALEEQQNLLFSATSRRKIENHRLFSKLRHFFA